MCHIHYNEQYSGGTWVVLFVCGPLISVLGSLVGDGDDSTDHSHRPLPDPVKCAQQTPQVGSWRGTCIFWNLLRDCYEIFWEGEKNIARCSYQDLIEFGGVLEILVLEVMPWTGRQWRLSRCRSSTLLLSSSLGHPTRLWEPGQCHKNKSIDIKDPVWILFCQGHHRQGFPAKHIWQGFN